MLTRVQVSLCIFEFFLYVRFETVLERLFEDLLVELERVLNVRDVLEVDLIGNSQTLHPEGMSPFLKVLLKGPSAPVAGTTAYFALELFTEAV